MHAERTLLLAMVLMMAVVLSGCAQQLLSGPVVTLVASDANAAAQVLTASAGLLPQGDPWLACMVTISQGVGMIQAGPGLKVDGGLLLTEAARLHVLDTLVQTMPTATKQACGAVFVELLLRAGMRAPGF